MTMRALLLTAVVALAVPALVSAEPKHNGTLDASKTEFKWSGGPLQGAAATAELNEQFPCGTPGHDCEDTLLNLPMGGDLTVKMEANDSHSDLDLYLYESDSTGKEGKELGASTGFQVAEQVGKARLKPGFYLVRVNAALAAGTTYDGVATVKNVGAAPPAGGGSTPGPGTSPTNASPTLSIGKVAKSVKASKLKGFKGKAADDKGVSRVEIALYSGKGGSCKAMDAKGAFKKASCQAPKFLAAKGTTSWSFKLKKKLKKGAYTLVARATDTDGATSSQKIAFKVK